MSSPPTAAPAVPSGDKDFNHLNEIRYFGLGLVGLVAQREEPVNLDNAEAHPSFQLLPGIGEESFRAFLGVPIVHQREALGVLVVQQAEQRRFDESEEAFLLTISAF